MNISVYIVYIQDNNINNAQDKLLDRSRSNSLAILGINIS